ncbi:Fc receptor, IgE, high affinity I, gamma polypeptide like [Periophthalmus magnuspinnatus]|uniref:Fc receptor, IgE, high affinity I, gamma polypeptide like n=1 Tax=Periophthalmus magnuspinnatus TaxID=409849 RepID=UPI00145BBC19|nr:Fc receptor, IgE, high affinity I, gamma polypeptide like [Periophthalmus magnuspinnatus]
MLVEMNYCYILDGILLLYGLILTVMYCRLRIQTRKKEATCTQKQAPEGGIYAVRHLSVVIKKLFKKARDHQGAVYAAPHGSDFA